MKHIYLLLLFCLPLCLSCKHEPLIHDFLLICDFPRFVSGKTVLIMDETGQVIHEVPADAGARGITTHFLMRTQNPEATFGVNLIADNWIEGGRSIEVYSHYGLQNGERVKLNAPSSANWRLPTTRSVEVKITGVFYIHYIEFGGQPVALDYSWATKTAKCTVEVADNSPLYLRVKANGKVKQIFVPNTGEQSSIELKWDDFAAENTQVLQSAMPFSDGPKNEFYCFAFATSPDFGRSLPLALNKRIRSDSLFRLRVPADLPNDWRICVLANSDSYQVEKSFGLGESFNLSEPTLDITKHEVLAPDRLNIRCSGSADLLSAECWSDEVPGVQYFYWQISAHPDHFGQLPIPQLKAHLPLAQDAQLADLFTKFTAKAFYSGQFDGADITRGFPWRSTEILAPARGGYERIVKE